MKKRRKKKASRLERVAAEVQQQKVCSAVEWQDMPHRCTSKQALPTRDPWRAT